MQVVLDERSEKVIRVYPLETGFHGNQYNDYRGGLSKTAFSMD